MKLAWAAAMAGPGFVNKFVKDFNRLWKNGHSANIKLRCKSGEAWLSLNVGLGSYHPAPTLHNPHQPGPLPLPSNHSQHGRNYHVKPSKIRRKEKRAEARKVASENATNTAAELAVDPVTEVVTSSTTSLPKDAGNASEACDEIVLAENVKMAEATTVSVAKSVAEAAIKSAVQETDEVSPKDAEIALKAVENVSAESVEMADTTTASESSITDTTTPSISHSLTQESLCITHPAIRTLPPSVQDELRMIHQAMDEHLNASDASALFHQFLPNFLEKNGFKLNTLTQSFSSSSDFKINQSKTTPVQCIEASQNIEPHTPQTFKAFSLLCPPDPPQKLTPKTPKSNAVRNLTPLFQPFQPSPPSSDLIHLTHPAVQLLPDELLGKLRKKVKNEVRGIDPKDEKFRLATHRAILEFTNNHDFTYDHFKKRFHPPLGWH